MIITDKQWTESYRPIRNPIDPDASCGGDMFETFGEDLEFVRRQNPNCIWTYADADNGEPFIQSGYHLVNRIGYFITEIPVKSGEWIQVDIT